MKIGEIEVGKEYALTQRSGDPRRVQVVEIVWEEDKHHHYNTVLERWESRTIRKVKIKYLDNAPQQSRFEYKKNSIRIVGHRELIALWEDIGPNIRERIEREAAEAKLREETEKRMKRLLGRNYDGYVTTMGGRGANLDIYGKSLLKLLELAELGAAKVEIGTRKVKVDRVKSRA